VIVNSLAPGVRLDQSIQNQAQLKFGTHQNAPYNNYSNRLNKQRAMHYGFALAFYKFTHLINPASSDGRAMDRILKDEIQFLGGLWSFCEDEFI